MTTLYTLARIEVAILILAGLAIAGYTSCAVEHKPAVYRVLSRIIIACCLLGCAMIGAALAVGV